MTVLSLHQGMGEEAGLGGPGLDNNLAGGANETLATVSRTSTPFSGYARALAFTVLISKMRGLRQMVAKVISSLKLVFMFLPRNLKYLSFSGSLDTKPEADE